MKIRRELSSLALVLGLFASVRLPIAILLMAFFGVSTLGSAQESSGFLLRQRIRLIWLEMGLDTTAERVIFRDGLIVTTGSTPQGVFISRRKAGPEALRNLHAAFRHYHIGEQRGECTQGSGQFDFVQDTFTWFSRGAAGHSFKIGDPFTEGCGPGLTLLLSAISDFIGSAIAEPGLQDVEIPN
jgi:hypothetical protein